MRRQKWEQSMISDFSVFGEKRSLCMWFKSSILQGDPVCLCDILCMPVWQLLSSFLYSMELIKPILCKITFAFLNNLQTITGFHPAEYVTPAFFPTSTFFSEKSFPAAWCCHHHRDGVNLLPFVLYFMEDDKGGKLGCDLRLLCCIWHRASWICPQWNLMTLKAECLSTVRKFGLSYRSWVFRQNNDPKHNWKHPRIAKSKTVNRSKHYWRSVERDETHHLEKAPLKSETME